MLAIQAFLVYTVYCCDIRVWMQKVAKSTDEGFSAERCPVQETGRQGHCTEYLKNCSVLFYILSIDM